MAMWAVFSEKQSERAGTSWWLAPDGREVEVTEVAPEPGCFNDCRFDDKKDLGEVVKFLRAGRPGASLKSMQFGSTQFGSIKSLRSGGLYD